MHRHLKSALKARLASDHWMADLPVVLLGLRSAWREGANTTPAELLYGVSLRLPGQFVPGIVEDTESSNTFSRSLFEKMRNIKPVPSSHHSIPRSYVPRHLFAAKSVFIRHDAVCKPLQRPYNGPFSFFSPGEKFFIVERNGSPYSVSVDCLKLACSPATTATSCLLYTSPSPRD